MNLTSMLSLFDDSVNAGSFALSIKSKLHAHINRLLLFIHDAKIIRKEEKENEIMVDSYC
jgi:hypothetical protein